MSFLIIFICCAPGEGVGVAAGAVLNVYVSDWPEGHRREIDPTNERNVGLLRAGYIVPLQLPRRDAPPAPREAAAKRSRRPRTGDE